EVVQRSLAQVFAEVRRVCAAAAVADDEDGLLVDVGFGDEIDHRLDLLAVHLREQLDEVAEVMVDAGPVRGGQHDASYRKNHYRKLRRRRQPRPQATGRSKRGLRPIPSPREGPGV